MHGPDRFAGMKSVAVSLFAAALLLVLESGAQSAESSQHVIYRLFVEFGDGNERLKPDGETFTPPPIHVSGEMTIPAPLPKTIRIALSRSFPKLELYARRQAPMGPRVVNLLSPIDLQPVGQTQFAQAWNLSLDPSVSRERSLTLTFYYGGGENAGRILAIGSNESYADGAADPWYPQVRTTENDADVPAAIGEVHYTFPAAKRLVSSGSLAEAKDGYARYSIQRPQPFSFALGSFQSVGSAGPTPFELNFLTRRPTDEQRRRWVKDVLERYVRWYGPYPHEAWRLVEVPVFAWGNDADDLVPYSTQLIEDWNDANFAHELSHPYWGGDYLANEGMATFAALETFEGSKGAAAAERFRRTGAPGYFENASGLGYLRIAAAGFDSPLGVPAGTNGAAQNVDFGKGMFVIDMLARTVGRDKFHAFLRSYWAEQRAQEFKNFSWAGFFTALSKSTGRNWQYFYDQWFSRGGAPDWTFTWHNENRVVVGEVVQAGEPFTFDLPLEGHDQDGHLYTTAVHVAGPHSTLRWTLPAVMREVKDDPHYTVLHWTPEYRALATALAPATRWNYRRYEGVDADLAAALAAVQRDDAYGTRFAIEYAWARTHIGRNNWSEAKRLLTDAMAERVVRTESVPYAYLSLARADSELKDVPAQRDALQRALAAARKYSDDAAAARAERQLAQLR
jgi:hypothetical protein